MTLKSPANKKEFDNIHLYYVGCIEQGERDDKLAWHLLTSEPVTTKEEALKIVSYYERRWLIEDFHKVWKSEGTQVEQLRMQSKDNLERLSVILAFIATRLLQLRFMNESETLSNNSCEQVLKGKAWKLMWLKLEEESVAERRTEYIMGLQRHSPVRGERYQADRSCFYKDIMARMV